MALRICKLLVGALAGLSMTISLAGCGSNRAEKQVNASAKARAIPVTVAPIAIKTVERTVEVVGTLKGFEEVVVGSKREGRVLKVLHDMGDRVKPGELLVMLETTDADLAVARAERVLQVELSKLGAKEVPGNDFEVKSVPSVVRAQVALERTRTNLLRERTLTARRAGALQDLQNAENDQLGAEAAYADAILLVQSNVANAQVAKVALDLAKQARIDMEIKAPIPTAKGLSAADHAVYAISKRQVAEGEMLKQGDPMFELVIEKPLRLWTNVPERYSAEIKLGQTARVTVASFPDSPFTGRVARINPSIDPVSRAFQVEVEVPNNEGQLRPGGFAKASILIDTKAEAVVVPLESVVKFAGGTKLFMVEGTKAKAFKIETGLEGQGWVEVLGSIPRSGNVVVTGQTQLAEGTDVILRDPTADLETKPKDAEGKSGAETPETKPTPPVPKAGI